MNVGRKGQKSTLCYWNLIWMILVIPIISFGKGVKSAYFLSFLCESRRNTDHKNRYSKQTSHSTSLLIKGLRSLRPT